MNILVIYLILTAFWVEVKLIPTLKVLAAISPITLFIIRRALISADCSVGEFKLVEKSKKE